MKQEIAQQWVDALRSGKYKQGRYRLRNKNDEFCCLGVLCNLHAIAHPDIAAKQKNYTRYLNQGIFLPRAVQQWAGMHTKDGSSLATAFSPATSLLTLNDSGQSFDQIAKVIEENVDSI